MKAFCFIAVAWIAGSGAAAAQTAENPGAIRGDVHFVVGWQNIRQEQPQDHYNDWINGIFYGGAGAGWHWTENLKTQVDVGAGTRGHQYNYRQITINGLPASESFQTRLQQTSVAVSQQYQFFRNQWFHPRLGVGVDFARQSTIREYSPVFTYDSVNRISRQVSPARTEGPDHEMVARPFGELGFKAYMSRRSFFSTDARIMVRGGIDEVLFRFGFGVDF
jgi:opacity protein-like surface antigen